MSISSMRRRSTRMWSSPSRISFLMSLGTCHQGIEVGVRVVFLGLLEWLLTLVGIGFTPERNGLSLNGT